MDVTIFWEEFTLTHSHISFDIVLLVMQQLKEVSLFFSIFWFI